MSIRCHVTGEAQHYQCVQRLPLELLAATDFLLYTFLASSSQVCRLALWTGYSAMWALTLVFCPAGSGSSSFWLAWENKTPGWTASQNPFLKVAHLGMWSTILGAEDTTAFAKVVPGDCEMACIQLGGRAGSCPWIGPMGIHPSLISYSKQGLFLGPLLPGNLLHPLHWASSMLTTLPIAYCHTYHWPASSS